MAKRCDLTGVGAQTGHKVSHSNRKAKRRFEPNLQNVSFLSNLLNKTISLRVTPATLRTVDHNGGLDNYLLTTSNLKLTSLAKQIKRKLKKTLAEKAEDAVKEKTAKKSSSKKPAKVKRPARKTPAEKAKVKAEKKIVKKKTTTKKPAAKKSVKKEAPAKKKATAVKKKSK